MEAIHKELEKLSFEKNLKLALSLLDDIELTEDEKDQAIIDAKIAKKKSIEHAEYLKKVEENRIKLTNTKFTYDQQYGLFLHRANALFESGTFSKRFLIDNDNREIIFLLCCYFTNDKRFEDAGYDLNKGICLAGNPGRGKSWLMKIFGKNTRQSFYIRGCKEVSLRYQKEGALVLEEFSNPIKAAYNDKDVFFQKEIGICFSDLGTEAVKKNFGNEVNVMEDILFERDRNNLRKDLTHMETNLNGDEIEAFYGIRIRSRIREMFNWIEVPGNDRRK